MAEMRIRLSEEWAGFVEGRVKEGGYADSGEVVEAALRAWAGEEAFRLSLEEAAAEIDRGEFVEYDFSDGGAAFWAGVRERGGRAAE